jgi:outer membrane protein OmpA-like peptidoglycan-associated protein
MLKQTSLLLAAGFAVTACATPMYGPGPGPAPGPGPYAQGPMAGPSGACPAPRFGPRARTGVLAGAAGGAVLGYLTNTNKSREGRENALIGAGIGALGGYAVGNYMDRQQACLQQSLAGTDVQVVRQGDSLLLQMPSDVTFAYDRADIQPQFFDVLDRVAATLNEFPATYVDVVGHADSRGADDYNLALSQRRASSVAQYLVARQVIPDRLFVAGEGERRPLVPNTTEENMRQNRRVEIVLRPHTARG